MSWPSQEEVLTNQIWEHEKRVLQSRKIKKKKGDKMIIKNNKYYFKNHFKSFLILYWKYIILMHFQIKNILKSKLNHNLKQPFKYRRGL
jgi:hypothetical protein